LGNVPKGRLWKKDDRSNEYGVEMEKIGAGQMPANENMHMSNCTPDDYF
jgi:hypothetical protein